MEQSGQRARMAGEVAKPIIIICELVHKNDPTFHWHLPDFARSKHFSTSQDRFESAAQGFVTEHEAVAKRLVGDDALASEQKLIGKIAAEAPEQRIRDAEHRRAV